MALDATHGLQDTLVMYAPVAYLLGHHALAGRFQLFFIGSLGWTAVAAQEIFPAHGMVPNIGQV
jgi:hypothetical protein